MNAQDFFELVGKMRAAQDIYYSSRTHSNLISAKEMEKMVDRELARGLDPVAVTTLEALAGNGKGVQLPMIIEVENGE